jgi:membrane protein
MKFPANVIHAVDTFQRNHSVFGFPYAVLKKYGADNGSYQAALITYYGLLSLFPLLIVFTTVTQLLLKNNDALRSKVSTSIAHYFPIIGTQLQQGVHSPTKTGIALIVTLLITFYGARSIASALQYAMSSLWYVPQAENPAFLKNILRSFGIIFSGGLGLVSAVVLSGFTTFLGHAMPEKILATLLSIIILWLMFIILFKLAIAGHKTVKQVIVQVLQTVGSAVLAHELKGLNSTYGTFALVIGLLFWISLQAQVILYAVEVDVVRAYHLFPRSLQQPLTAPDKDAYVRYAKSARQHANEEVKVTFENH